MVHGDIKGVRNHSDAHLSIVLTPGQSNILVDDSGCPRITDFGSTIVAPDGDQDSLPTTEPDHDHTGRWTAPEILMEEGTRSKETDVFSFAMVMVEVRCRHPSWLDC